MSLAGMSSGVAGLIPKSVSGKMMGMGAGIARNVVKAGAKAGRGAAPGSFRDTVANRGILRAGGAMARHPLRTSAGAIGLGGAIGARAMNRRGSQNYPMY